MGDENKVGKMESGLFGERMPNGYVLETGTPYRAGIAYMGYGNMKMGINSDRWIRHPIQDMFADNLPGTKQPGFITLSNSINPYM